MAKWYELVTGSLEERKRYKDLKARQKALPDGYRTAAEGLSRYLMYAGGIDKSDVLLAMLEDLVELFEHSAAAGTPVPEMVGEDPVEFAEDFLTNYDDGRWINKERARLAEAVERATAENRAAGEKPEDER